MGKYTVGVISEEHGVMDVARIIERTYGVYTKLKPSSVKHYYQLAFEFEGDEYLLTVVENHVEEGFQGTYLQMVRHGISYGVIQSVVSHYGGMSKVDENMSFWEELPKMESKMFVMKVGEDKRVKFYID